MWLRHAAIRRPIQALKIPPFQSHHFSAMAASNVKPKVGLSSKEATLRSLLLDVSAYIHRTDKVPEPQLRFAGGWVRDKLLGTGSKDIDVAIDSMTGEKFGLAMKRFLEDREQSSHYSEDVVRRIAKIEANPEKSKNLETATTNVLGLDIDLVNLRKEVYTDESRNPQIEPATPEEDALRRDATVNALFYNLQTEEVEDFTGHGLKDMELKVIRTPLEPFHTFKDDPLRVLRCIRFASRLGYAIDPETLKFMSDERIQDALQVKISRERVGIEMEKMLAGPDPRMALELIDQQRLYTTIFTDPQNPGVLPLGTNNWSLTYNLLEQILKDNSKAMQSLRSVLLPSKAEVTYAWTVCSFIPWGRKEWPTELKISSRSKQVFPGATVVAREGLKLDKKTVEIVNNAVSHSVEVEQAKNDFAQRIRAGDEADFRESTGLEIRRWGAHWRSTVIYALLHEGLDNDHTQIAKEYAAWLSKVTELDLLDAVALKPIVNGKEVMKAMGRPSGPWLTQALEAVICWQLRNPNSKDKEAAIKFALERVAQ